MLNIKLFLHLTVRKEHLFLYQTELAELELFWSLNCVLMLNGIV